MLQLKAGQFKAPFGRQELTSSGNQQFVDRSIASVLFAPARQLGLQIGGQFGTSQVPDMLTYAGGVFNGNGINRPANENDKYEYTGRVMFSPFGNVGYSESNLEHYAFRVSFAVDYNNNNNFIVAPDGVVAGVDNTGEWGTDIAIKALGGLFLYGEYYWRNLETACGSEHAADGLRRRRSAGSSETTSRSRVGTPSPTSTRPRRPQHPGVGRRVELVFQQALLEAPGRLRRVEKPGRERLGGVPPAKNKEFRHQAQFMF